MKSKVLLLGAVLAMAASVQAASNAVYSVNIVGYVKTDVPAASFLLIANPLAADTNTLASLIPNPPQGTKVFKFDPALGTYRQSRFLAGSWTDPSLTLLPGEGAFVQNTSPTNFTLLFAGSLTPGLQTNQLPNGFDIKSSVLPVTGALETDLKFPAVNGDKVFIYNPPGNNYFQYRKLSGSWIPSEPVVVVGQSFFVQKNGATTWIQNFVNTN